MYVGTIFIIDDQSDIPSLTIANTIDKPIEMIGFTSDKGTEDYAYVEGDAFFKQYGNSISFARHGQPLLQAANAINSGARLFCKRVVAQDSTLANNGLVAYVETQNVQRTDEDGNLLYYDADRGVETTSPTDHEGLPNDPVVDSKVHVSYNLKSLAATESNDLTIVAQRFKDSVTEEYGYPLCIFTDVGRGVSNKRLTITPDYNLSRTFEYTKYIIQVNEENEQIAELVATLNPDIVEGDENTSFQTQFKYAANPQLRCKFFDDEFTAFVNRIKEILASDAVGMSAEDIDALDLANQDLLFGKTFKGAPLNDNIIVDTNTQLNSLYGISMDNGSNGSFGNAPINTDTYKDEMVKVFDGSLSDDIYNVDNNPIDVIVDANYHDSVKRAIENLVNFREDCFYFRDIGNEAFGVRQPCKSIRELEYADLSNLKTRYAGTYSTWYDIIDPYTKKEITVTVGYSLARILVSHFINGRNRPPCGIKMEATIPEAIEGTVNFIPKITPAGNQKTEMEDLRINYAAYINGTLTLETCYTSQERFTQLSYINNVLAIQQIIHEIRKKVPIIRYSFLDGEDFENYQKEVNSLLSNYSGNFEELTMEYVEDSVYRSNKIFYAVLKVKFRNFVQTEIFKILALQS